MRKRVLILAVCAICLCACGKDSDNHPVSDATISVQNNIDNTVSDDTKQNTESDLPAKEQEKLAEIIVKDDKHADFIFYGDGSGDLSDITALVMSFGEYAAGLNDFDLKHVYQCSIWTGNNLFEDGKAEYQIENDRIIISADMSEVSDFSFADISGDCNVYYAYGDNGGPQLTFAWADVVDMSGYVPGDGSEMAEIQNDESQDAEQTTVNSYWFLDKTLSSKGGSWGASNITLSGMDSDGFPTRIVVSGSGYSVDGEALDGSFSIHVSECNDEVLMGEFSGASHVSIKGEYFDGDGKCLTVDIY